MPHNLLSVEEEIKKINIPYKGFLFTGAKVFDEPICEKTALFQFKHLVEKRRWISDADVQKLLNK
jgi:hypothetical protein